MVMENGAHAATGALFGAATSSTIASATGAELVLGIGTTVVGALLGAGAALLPDLDADGASAYRSGGPITWAVGESFQALARLAYRTTRLRHDPSGDGEHRGLVHTPIFAAALGLLVALGALVSDWVTAVVMVLVIAPGIGALSRSGPKWVRKRFGTHRDMPALLAAVAVTTLLWMLGSINQLGWYAGAVITIGMVVHSAGDSATRSGIPWLWPLLRACEKCETNDQREACPGSRWRRSHVLPERLRWRVGSPTGKTVERSIEVACLAGVGLLLVPDLLVLAHMSA